MIGQVIGGYRFERMIAAGSVGEVYVGTHTKLRRTAAIKIVNLERAEDPCIVERVVNEARVVNSIRHPAIVDISDIVEVETPRAIALVMEHIEGPSLKALLASVRRPSFAQAMSIAAQLAEALGAAHAAGVVHRDIKPANLLLASELDPSAKKAPRLKIVDFGIAKLRGAAAMTAAGIIIGTPAYMAPEQITSSHPPSPATDVYAVAEVLWELISGQRVYPRMPIAELVRAKAKGELPELALPDTPGAVLLRSLVVRGLARDPRDRPSLVEIRDTVLAICPEAAPRQAWPRRPSPPKAPVRTDTPTEEEMTEMTVHEATLEMLVPPRTRPFTARGRRASRT